MDDTKKGIIFINDVLLVLSFDQSLLSVGKMMQNGHSLHFEGEVCTIRDLKHHKKVEAEVKMGNCINFPIHWQYQMAVMGKFDKTTL